MISEQGSDESRKDRCDRNDTGHWRERLRRRPFKVIWSLRFHERRTPFTPRVSLPTGAKEPSYFRSCNWRRTVCHEHQPNV
jgi:hypothetical protein